MNLQGQTRIQLGRHCLHQVLQCQLRHDEWFSYIPNGSQFWNIKSISIFSPKTLTKYFTFYNSFLETKVEHLRRSSSFLHFSFRSDTKSHLKVERFNLWVFSYTYALYQSGTLNETQWCYLSNWTLPDSINGLIWGSVRSTNGATKVVLIRHFVWKMFFMWVRTFAE